MKVLINKEINIDKWNSLLNTSIFSSPFQSPEYYDFFNSVEGFSADVFAIENKDKYKTLVVVTIQKEQGIKSFFSKRGIIYGGALAYENEGDYLASLLKAVTNYYKRKLIYLEIRNNFNYSSFIDLIGKSNWAYNKHLNVQLNTFELTMDDILSKMKYNRRREIKISIKEGTIVQEATNENEVTRLYDILKDLYIKRVKLPIPPVNYFINLYKSSIGKVFIVSHKGKIIGGAFCVYAKGITINTLYYVGLRGYHKKIFPTHIAIMGAIEFAINNKLKMVDFMGAGKPDEDYGVRDYKLEFGGELVEHGRFINILNPVLFKVGQLGLKFLSRIK